jgi:acyl-CoA thioesterase
MDEAESGQRLAEAVGRQMYASDNASRALGITLEAIAPGYARMRMSVRADMINGHGIGHGGLTFTLADTAFAYACNSRNRVTVASGAEIIFLSPAQRGETLVAEAQEQAATGRTGVYDIEVTEAATGRQVALFRGRSHRLDGSVLNPPEESAR